MNDFVECNALGAKELKAIRMATEGDIAQQWNRTSDWLGSVSATPTTVGSCANHNKGRDVEFVVDAHDGDDSPRGVLPWATYSQTVDTTDHQAAAIRDACGRHDASQRIRDIVGEQIVDKARRVIEEVEMDAIIGTGVDPHGKPTLVGLMGGALAASGGYAGLSASKYSKWAANVISNGGIARCLTPEVIASADALIFHASHEPWNLTLMTAGVGRRYESMFMLGLAGGMYYRGYPAIRARHLPRGLLVLANTRRVRMKYLVTDADGSGGPIPAASIPFEVIATPSALILRVTLAMCVTRRNAFCVVRDIAEGPDDIGRAI
jgi:hypothetical protein